MAFLLPEIAEGVISALSAGEALSSAAEVSGAAIESASSVLPEAIDENPVVGNILNKTQEAFAGSRTGFGENIEGATHYNLSNELRSGDVLGKMPPSEVVSKITEHPDVANPEIHEIANTHLDNALKDKLRPELLNEMNRVSNPETIEQDIKNSINMIRETGGPKSSVISRLKPEVLYEHFFKDGKLVNLEEEFPVEKINLKDVMKGRPNVKSITNFRKVINNDIVDSVLNNKSLTFADKKNLFSNYLDNDLLDLQPVASRASRSISEENLSKIRELNMSPEEILNSSDINHFEKFNDSVPSKNLSRFMEAEKAIEGEAGGIDSPAMYSEAGEAEDIETEGGVFSDLKPEEIIELESQPQFKPQRIKDISELIEKMGGDDPELIREQISNLPVNIQDDVEKMIEEGDIVQPVEQPKNAYGMPIELNPDYVEPVEGEAGEASDKIKDYLIAGGLSATGVALFDKIVNDKETDIKDLNVIKDITSDYKLITDKVSGLKKIYEDLLKKWNSGNLNYNTQRKIKAELDDVKKELQQVENQKFTTTNIVNKTLRNINDENKVQAEQKKVMDIQKHVKQEQPDRKMNDSYYKDGVLGTAPIKIYNNFQSPESFLSADN